MRHSWLYITSGHSNPWEQSPAEFDTDRESGAGVEFTLATTEPGDWAIRTLQSMLAFDILLTADPELSQFSASTTEYSPVAHQIMNTLVFTQ